VQVLVVACASSGCTHVSVRQLDRVTDPIRVLLAEEDKIVRQGLRALFATQAEIEVVGEAVTGEEAVLLSATAHPHIVLMDVDLRGLGAVEATRRIRAVHPGIKVVILRVREPHEQVRAAVMAGASAYLTQRSGIEEIVAAIGALAAGSAFGPCGDDLPFALGSSTERNVSDLTPRERQVLTLVAAGSSSHQIALELGLSIKTVEGHRGRIMAKLDVRNVAGLVRSAIRLGLVE